MGNLKEKNYFEGWYFKQVFSKGKTISIIPGISINNHKKEAFIQIIETITNNSYYIPYKFEDVEFGKKDFYIKIKNNYFSKDQVILDIDENNLTLKGTLKYTNLTPLSKTFYRPTIMGPFSYVKHMQCNHGIISMHHSVSGKITINNKKLKLKNGIGYIEKDYGTSFPKKYLWLHSNNSQTPSKISLTLSNAHIPFGLTSFQGFFCILLLNNKEYYFTTYYKNKIKIEQLNNEKLHISLKNKNYELDLIVIPTPGHKLIAPKHGTMIKTITEDLNTSIVLNLKERKTNKTIYNDYLINAGFEYVPN